MVKDATCTLKPETYEPEARLSSLWFWQEQTKSDVWSVWSVWWCGVRNFWNSSRDFRAFLVSFHLFAEMHDCLFRPSSGTTYQWPTRSLDGNLPSPVCLGHDSVELISSTKAETVGLQNAVNCPWYVGLQAQDYRWHKPWGVLFFFPKCPFQVLKRMRSQQFMIVYDSLW